MTHGKVLNGRPSQLACPTSPSNSSVYPMRTYASQPQRAFIGIDDISLLFRLTGGRTPSESSCSNPSTRRAATLLRSKRRSSSRATCARCSARVGLHMGSCQARMGTIDVGATSRGANAFIGSKTATPDPPEVSTFGVYVSKSDEAMDVVH